LTTCFQTLTSMGLRKSSKQWPTAHCMYVWQHDLKVDTIIVKQVTIFNDFADSQWFLSRRMRYSVWIHCCKRPNYDFWISQGSVATALRWGRQNYSHLRQLSSWCCVPKIIKIGQCLTELFKKQHWHSFSETQCTYASINIFKLCDTESIRCVSFNFITKCLKQTSGLNVWTPVFV